MKNYVKVTTDIVEFLNNDFEAILIAVPTEKDGEPYFDAINSAIGAIKDSKHKDTLVIIESTLTPGVSEKYIAPYIKNFAVCPRRDWLGFDEPGRTLQNLPRIVGGSNEESTKMALDLLKEVCNTLHPCSYKEAELVKATENSMRHIGSVYAQQLALGYPELDTRKILKLAATKWNVPEYYPNVLGTSGYCIPISSKYIIHGAENKDVLTIPEETLKLDDSISELVAGVIKSKEPKKIAILGLAYLGNIKVHILSGAMRLIEHLDKEIVYVHDPLYTKEEIESITGCNYLNFPEDLKDFDIIVVASGHDFYEYCDREQLKELTKDAMYILDNSAIWERKADFKCKYIVPGRRNWIKNMK